MSAVSNSVMPRSSALWITRRVASSSMRPPKLLQPRPIAETRRPDVPRLRISKWGFLAGGSEVQQPGNILAAFGRSVKVKLWPDGHDAGRIDPLMALIIVSLDVHEVDRRGDAGDLIDVARICP